MTTTDIFNILQGEIHSTVFATLDQNGLPQTCVIDLMLADESGLYFLTAKGKSFYDRLTARPFVAISGMKGSDTLSTVAVSVRGAVRNIGKERLKEIFEKNLLLLIPFYIFSHEARFEEYEKEIEETILRLKIES